MTDNIMFKEAIEAVRQGQRSRARDLLTRLLRADQNNPEYWIWMSSVVDSVKEQVYCLQSAIRLDPSNATARRGLILLGASVPPEGTPPVPLVRRKWEAAIKEETEYPKGLRGLFARPLFRAGSLSAMGIILAVLIFSDVFGSGPGARSAVTPPPTRTYGPTPTYTTTPTFIVTVQTKAPTRTPPNPRVSPTPTHWAFVPNFVPTATPLYVVTPHNFSEAFSAGQRAYQRGEIEDALSFFLQASKVEPGAADIHFYVGEIYRISGKTKEALQAYEKAVEADPDFGPAYVGAAQMRLLEDPEADVAEDLDLAIEKDPNYGPAYLERALYRINHEDIEGAEDDLFVAEELLPDSPFLYLYRAYISFSEEAYEQAQEEVQAALTLNPSLSPGYLVLGQAALKNKDVDLAQKAFEAYLSYAKDDPLGWVGLGRAAYENRQYQKAVEAFTHVLELDPRSTDALLYRALSNLELDETRQAVNDLVAANRIDRASFEISFNLGCALFADGRLADARAQLNASEALIETDEQWAHLYYERAQVQEALENKPGAVRDWQALLKLPRKAVPREWSLLATKRLAELATPTPEK